MKPPQTHLLLATLVVVTLFLVVSTTLAGGTKVEICHIPPGNPGNFHTIKVNVKALSAHLAHGDIGSACDGNCATLCDDGDACTSDDNFDCEQVGCPAARDAVDCDDSNPCTTDSCDSAEGCLNEAVTCTAPDACTISMCAPDSGACVDAPVQCDPGQECNPDSGQCEDTGGSGCGAEGDTCETVIPQSVCDEIQRPNIECGITQSGVCSVNLGCVIPTSGCNMPIFQSCEAIGFGGCCANGAYCYLTGDPTCETPYLWTGI